MLAAQSDTHPIGWDPYRNFRFKLKWDGRYVAGFTKTSGLDAGTKVVPNRVGGDPSVIRLPPGQAAEPGTIVLERGATHDLAFQQWANTVFDYGKSSPVGDPTVSVKDFRKDIILDVYDEAGRMVLAYTIHRSWVSEFEALAELDGSANATAIQTLKLENEGWERNQSVTEPSAGSPSP